MHSVKRRKQLAMYSVTLAIVFFMLNASGALKYPIGTNTGIIINVGVIAGFILAVFAVLEIVRIPD